MNAHLHRGLRPLVGFLALLFTHAAAAQTAALPSMSFLTAPLVSPTAAESSYGTATTHSSSFAGVSGFEGRPPEIVETARALKNDPNLIFEFVRNHIDTEFAFGARKGALGTFIDRSGTLADQNILFVELVRQAGYAARYRIGRATFQAADFTALTGVSDLQAACRMLSSGGIPAAFNGAGSSPADCSATGALSSVTLLHVWSEVNIGGSWYVFDPSFKRYSGPAARNLAAGSGLTPGGPLSQALSGYDAGSAGGAPYVHNLNTEALASYLQARGTQLLQDFQTGAPDQDLAGVLGLRKIVAAFAAQNGNWRATSLAGYTPDLQIDGDLPDQYRTKLHVTVSAASQVLLDRQLYADEISGRRLGINTNFDAAHIHAPNDYFVQQLRLELDDVPLATFDHGCPTGSYSSQCWLPGIYGTVTLTADHPYAANGGTYADQTVTRATNLTIPVTIVQGWGWVSPQLAAKWSSERADDKSLPPRVVLGYQCDPSYLCMPEFETPAGDVSRQQLAASWLAQFSHMLALQSSIAGMAGEHHHTLGVVASRYQLATFQPPPTTNPLDFGIQDAFTMLDIDSAVSLTSQSNDFAKVRSVARSVAQAGSTLEGSVLEQSQDLPDSASTASRFAWANRPDEDPCNTGARRFYDFTGQTTAARNSLLVYEGSSSGCGATAIPNAVGTSTQGAPPSRWISNANTVLDGYVSAGFKVTAPAETFLGPGWRAGPPTTATLEGGTPSDYNGSRQRGGALIATLSDSTGAVLQVAHTLSDIDGRSKGGGGAQPERYATYDPKKAADVLKDRFVDRSVALGVDLRTGTVGYTTPVLQSVGSGEAPYKLDQTYAYKPGPSGCSPQFSPCTNPLQGGWTHSWDWRFSLSGSGAEAMGATSPQAATGSLVAWLAMQDIYAQSGPTDLQKDVAAALVADWWRRQMAGNVATLSQGFSGRQYVRLVDGTWLVPIGSPGVLTLSQPRVKVRDVCVPDVSGNHKPAWSSARRWDQSNSSFSLRSAGGDVVSVVPWTYNYSQQADNCALTYGYRIASWTFPQGGSISFDSGPFGVSAIHSHVGRSLSSAAPVYQDGGVQGQAIATKVGNLAGESWLFDYTAPAGRSSLQRPVPYPELAHVYEPVNSTLPALEYVYDTLGRVKQASDATALQWKTRGANQFFIAENARGERTDPAGGSYVVNYDTDGNAFQVVDEIGRSVLSTYDGRHRVTSRTYPEGDRDAFAYDARDNVVQLTRNPKPGSALAPIVVKATYESTWNKIATLIDARNQATDFSYHTQAGDYGLSQIYQAVRPAVNGSRPTYTFDYYQTGLPSRTTDPTGVQETYAFDSVGNMTAVNKATAAANGSPALNLQTTYAYDGVGNLVTTTDPRNASTTTQYDVMRRKVWEQDRDFGGASASPLAERHWVYDLNGRVTQAQVAKSIPTDGSFGPPTTTTTTYTPTGKTASVTDPAGGVTYSTYDALDRPALTIDATGLVTALNYDAAGQLLSECRAVGTPLHQGCEQAGQSYTNPYARYSWSPDGNRTQVLDARGFAVNFVYDEFNRLWQTHYPIGNLDLFEQSDYDPNGNVVRWINRGGFKVQRTYDALNRKISEKGAGDDGTPNTNTRWWDIQDRSFTYDAAGRLTAASTPQWSQSWAFDAAGRPKSYANGMGTFTYAWDGSGNLVSNPYPGFSQGFEYDALGRMTAAYLQRGSDASPTRIASLEYDARSRRTGLTFGDLSYQAYGYDEADRLTSITHHFPNSTGYDVTFGYGYDMAGRETVRTISNGAFAYGPGTGTQAYAAADAWNRYPSIDGVALSGFGEGGVGNDTAGRYFNYDEFNRLAYADPGAGAGSAYYGTATGETYERLKLNPGGSDVVTFFGSNGVRPEEVMDTLLSRPNGSSSGFTLLGSRYSVLGPNDDERLAWVDRDGTIRYPHTDKLGSTVALSLGGGLNSLWNYGPFGETPAPINDNLGPNGYAYRYTGQRLDSSTGIYHYKVRDYVPAWGRFLQPDPAGVDQGTNLYAYVGNDPLRSTDPSGLEACTGSHIDCGPGGGIAPGQSGGTQAGPAHDDWSRRAQPESASSRVAQFFLGLLPGYDLFKCTSETCSDGRGNLNARGWIAAAGLFAIIPGEGVAVEEAEVGARAIGSQVDRAAFASQRRAFWKREAETNAKEYTGENLSRMQSGRAPIGSDGHPVELHHVSGSSEGGLRPMTRTEHRLGPNYKENHPWTKR